MYNVKLTGATKMRDDYTAVFRNIRTARRFDASEYRNNQEPGWLPWVGGFVAGLIFCGIVLAAI